MYHDVRCMLRLRVMSPNGLTEEVKLVKGEGLSVPAAVHRLGAPTRAPSSKLPFLSAILNAFRVPAVSRYKACA